MHERKKRNDTGKQIRLITYILNNSVWYIQVWRGEWNKIIFADAKVPSHSCVCALSVMCLHE